MTKKKATAPAIVEAANEEVLIANENAIEAFVEGRETEEAETVTEDTTGDVTVEVTVDAKKRVRGYAQTAISLEDHRRLSALKNHWKESLNLTVSNSDIITAAIDLLSHEEHLENFMKRLVTSADDKQRAKDFKKFNELKAKLEA